MKPMDQAEFLGQVAHEVRTPMHIIGGALLQILNELEFGPNCREFDDVRNQVDTAQQQIERLHQRITEMLVAARGASASQ
jgi:signal transduction histidine kinase